MGVFRDVARPSYDQLLNDQIAVAKTKAPGDADALASLLHGEGPPDWFEPSRLRAACLERHGHPAFSRRIDAALAALGVNG
jgi:hypothetical protein